MSSKRHSSYKKVKELRKLGLWPAKGKSGIKVPLMERSGIMLVSTTGRRKMHRCHKCNGGAFNQNTRSCVKCGTEVRYA